MIEKKSRETDLPEGWSSELFPGTIVPAKAARSKQVQANAYLSQGKYPVVDQGQTLIAGWTNNEPTIIRDNLPLIVFGDHTRVFKCIDFPFAIGADGTKLIKPQSRFHPRYFYYQLLHLDIPSKGYSRHYRLLREKVIQYPPLPEQKKIATVLLKIQKAIEVQEKIIITLRELKKSTMQFVFSRGLRGEKTKMTEIGEIPESWGIRPLNEVTTRTEIVNPSKDPDRMIKYVDVSGVSNESLRIISATEYRLINAPGRARKIIRENDVIFATVRPALKRIAFVESEYDNQVCSTAFCVLRSIPSLADSRFIFYAVQKPEFIISLKKIQTGASYPAITDKQLKAQAIQFPKLDEQCNIASILFAIDKKLSLQEFKKSALQDLFKTILNKLMTGKIRVNDLDIDTSEVEDKITCE